MTPVPRGSALAKQTGQPLSTRAFVIGFAVVEALLIGFALASEYLV